MSKVRIGIVGSRFQADCIAASVRAVPEEAEVVAVPSPWFWDVAQSGGGAVMDLGCHGIAFCWWFLGKPKVKSVYSQMSQQVQRDRAQGEDEAITIIEFENGALGVVENSWNRPGGMDDSIEVFGDKGQTYADMLMGNALPTYSEVGFGYAVENAATTKGWSYP